MATYAELYDISQLNNLSDLIKRINVALSIKAWAIIESASPPAAALAWAKDCLQDPNKYVGTALRAALADNAAATTSAIANAGDAAVQTVINDLVDKLLAK